VAEALIEMVEAGKVRQIGVSNYSPLKSRPCRRSCPSRWSHPAGIFGCAVCPLYDGTLDQAMERDMAVLAWSPLGSGRLTDPAHPVGASGAAGRCHGTDASAAALSWIWAHPRGSCLSSARSNRAALRPARCVQVEWTRGEWYAVLAASRGEPMP
jgi:predicted oxidoreductase